MQHRNGNSNRYLWLLAPLLVLILLSTPSLRVVGWVVLRLLIVGGAVGGV
ncbi:MAG: hypothetical protein K0Q72_4879, partial [Armatimonadetes bacterium]|nr:hypothetical protein [Armatimonadota bacterium]